MKSLPEIRQSNARKPAPKKPAVALDAGDAARCGRRGREARGSAGAPLQAGVDIGGLRHSVVARRPPACPRNPHREGEQQAMTSRKPKPKKPTVRLGEWKHGGRRGERRGP